MSKNLFALNLTALLLPENERYSTGSILYLETRFSNGIVKNKYLVLIDDEEPPLFFFINTKPDRRKWNECIIELSPERYTFLDHASYLDYFTEASALDYVD